MTKGLRPQAAARGRIIDFAIYIVIALAIGLGIIGLARAEINGDAFVRWGGLSVNTAALFGYFICDSRLLFRMSIFWILTCAMLSAHLVVFSIILTHATHWKLIWFLVMYLELPVLVFVRDRIPTRRGPR